MPGVKMALILETPRLILRQFCEDDLEPFLAYRNDPEVYRYQGWQIPLSTDAQHGKARIEGIDGATLIAAMEAGEVPVVAGFQGVGPENRIATLGRGGSDTSAVKDENYLYKLQATLPGHRYAIQMSKMWRVV